MKIVKRLLILTAIFMLLLQVPFSCAQRGRPDGGPKDTIPPTFVNALPPNYSTHFNKKVIRINFDEYIKLKEPNKHILISPPMKNKPVILPMGQASKYVEVQILDTLPPETTYTINFGQSIVDNNESNPYPFFKYVFSTGDYIDSLKVTGSVVDAFQRETEPFISVMLYRLDSTYSDSLVYQESPDYIAYTQDSTNTFAIENVEAGDYRIVAVKDRNQNYKFNPKDDKIGFLTDTIHLPQDSTASFHLQLFKQVLSFEPIRPEQVSRRHLLFGIEGGTDSVSIELISPQLDDFTAQYYPRIESDSIDYWFDPYIDADSLVFTIAKGVQIDTIVTKIMEKDLDSLRLSAEPTGNIPMLDTFYISANTPLVALDTSKIQVLNKDSLAIDFAMQYHRLGNRYTLDFEKETEGTYYIQALPGAFTDMYAAVNDTLQYKLSTKAQDQYADVRITLQNIASYPVIVQLASDKGETKRELIHTQAEGATFDFKYVDPGNYYVRVIYDTNANGIWDTGDYWQKTQPEEVIYMQKPLEVRKNWEITQTFILKP